MKYAVQYSDGSICSRQASDNSIFNDIAYDHYFYDPENPQDPRTNLDSKHGRLTLNLGSEQTRSTSTLWLYKTDYLKLQELYEQREALEEEILKLYGTWETLSAQLEEARG